MLLVHVTFILCPHVPLALLSLYIMEMTFSATIRSVPITQDSFLQVSLG